MGDIQVNFREIKGVEKALNELDKSAIPIAIRETLNDLAFRVRKVDMPKEYHKAMVAKGQGKRLTRTKLFQVDKAEGFDVDNMRSEMGAIKGFGAIAQGMKTQQAGANIVNRGYIPVEGARGSVTSPVKKSAYLDTVKGKLLNRRKVSRRTKAGTKASRVIADLFMAKKLGLFIVGRNAQGKFGKDNIYLRTQKVTFAGRGPKREGKNFNNKRMYVHKNRVTNRPTAFLNKAGLSGLKKFEKMYQKNLQKQFDRVSRKHGL